MLKLELVGWEGGITSFRPYVCTNRYHAARTLKEAAEEFIEEGKLLRCQNQRDELLAVYKDLLECEGKLKLMTEADVAWAAFQAKQRQLWATLRANFDAQILASETAQATPGAGMVSVSDDDEDLLKQVEADKAAAA